jgi:hypothetical protein
MERRVKWLVHLHDVVNKAYSLSYKAQDVVKNSKFLNYGLLYRSSHGGQRLYEEARPRIRACV